ncbi:hypothetical protein [Caballeronia sp. LZ019]|uniref:hypothetical protein n=1 Tax=Caballeronia sp. LZ019 TaxID=3038555 RepID=UPI0028663F1E|nr:hypothetical protein [Caballeronia sp. LZ019]MDR5811192.1 hypothetical protein [Caballeronia sp. LZ019]
MTAIIVQTISAGETALTLYRYLGTLRNWTNFLGDNIRGEQSIAGCTLMPCARRHDGKSYRPVYAVSDVKAFIENVRKVIPSAGKKTIKTTAVSIDPGRHWRVNKFDRDGAPVARLWAVRRAPLASIAGS